MVQLAFVGGLALAASALADVTITVNDVPPLPLSQDRAVTSASALLNASCPEELPPRTPYNASLLLSAYTSFEEPVGTAVFPAGTIYPSSDSLVRSALEAWAQHQHLVLRPDEVWFEVLAQMNFYVSAHAEELRHLFVDFEGKQEIVVSEFSWGAVIRAFAGEIQKRVKTDWLEGWIMPGFSTSGENDGMTATVLMMGLVKSYFEFSGSIICGLPKVTLLGEKGDWERLLAKLDRLPEFGDEPKQYADNLRPILTRFVKTFDDPGSEEMRSFWENIVRADHHFTCGKGPIEYDVTGWMLGFLHWRPDGQPRVPAGRKPYVNPSGPQPVTLDGVTYVSQPMDELPVGYAKAPLKMLDYPSPGESTMAYLLAGNVGVNRTDAGDGFVRAQPMSSWFMYGPVDEGYNMTGALGSVKEVQGIYEGMRVQESCPGYQAPIEFVGEGQ